MHGYDLFELIQKKTFVEVFFLLYAGELPGTTQCHLLEGLMIFLSNPGPRNPATRAAMNAGIGRTNTAHILPIGLSALSGLHNGAQEVTASMRFFLKHIDDSPNEIAHKLLKNTPISGDGDLHIIPGLGSRFGEIDPIPQDMAELLLYTDPQNKFINWGSAFIKSIPRDNIGWLETGLAAAVFCSFDLPARAGAGLYQILRSPGILAHGLEMADKPLSAMPFLDDKHYIIEK